MQIRIIIAILVLGFVLFIGGAIALTLLFILPFVLLFGALLMLFRRMRERSTVVTYEQVEVIEPAEDGLEEAQEMAAAGRTVEQAALLRQSSGIGLCEALHAVQDDAVEREVLMLPSAERLELTPDVEDAIRLIAQQDKLEAIRTVRKLTGAGLKKAKTYVDGLVRTHDEHL